jgi:S1-C subfamily serine protease
VREVDDGGAAAQAGIREGDMIVAAGGTAIVEPDDIYDALGAVNGSSTLQVSLVRGAEELSVEVRFEGGATPAAEDAGPIH